MPRAGTPPRLRCVESSENWIDPVRTTGDHVDEVDLAVRSEREPGQRSCRQAGIEGANDLPLRVECIELARRVIADENKPVLNFDPAGGFERPRGNELGQHSAIHVLAGFDGLLPRKALSERATRRVELKNALVAGIGDVKLLVLCLVEKVARDACNAEHLPGGPCAESPPLR